MLYHIPVKGIIPKGTKLPACVIVWDSCRYGMAVIWIQYKERA